MDHVWKRKLKKKMSTFRLSHEERDRVSRKDRLSAEVVAIISDY